MKKCAHLSRRRFLGSLGLGGAALLFRDLLPFGMPRLQASTNEPLFLIYATFEGGWDQLLALDPRDHTQYGDPEGVIYTAYDQLADNDATLDSLLTSNPTGLLTPSGSNITFGPGVGRLAEGNLYEDLCVLRGVNMGTLTHEVGRRYLLTGKFPRGLSASGSSLGTVLVDGTGDQAPIPNLVVGLETYNEGLASYASGLVVRNSSDLQDVLTPTGEPLSAGLSAQVDAYIDPDEARCADTRLNGNGQIDQYQASRIKANTMVEANLGSLFNFPTTPTSEAMQELYDAFHISSTRATANSQLAGSAGQAMIAAQAIANGVSQAVSIKLADGIDTHDDDYLTNHLPTVRSGFDALADLITWLKGKIHPTTGKSYWEHTVLVASSDFARTPNLNNRSGRDHHLSSSLLVAGRGIQGNRVIGATDGYMAGLGIDLTTGAAVGQNGTVIRPPDIHATLLYGAGLSYDHLSNQNPVLIPALLKG